MGMNHGHEPDYNLLADYLSGMASPSEVAEVERWLGENPEQSEIVGQMRGVWDVVQNPSRPRMDVEAMTRRVVAMVGDNDRGAKQVSLTTLPGLIGADAEGGIYNFGVGANKVKSWGRRAVGVGALTTAIVIAIAGIKYVTPLTYNPSAISQKTFSTSTGQRAKLRLADGSQVILNAKSTIRYPENFGKGTRDIYLDGEALFTVTSSEGAPFIVHSDNLTTRVLGTSFAVRKYSTDSSIRVIVAQGKVSLGATVLATGDEAIAITQSKVTVRHRADVSSSLAWTDGELVFTAMPFRNAIPDLERWYGIRFSTTDTRLLNEPITVSFKSESIDEIAGILARILGAEVSRSGAQVTFLPR